MVGNGDGPPKTDTYTSLSRASRCLGGDVTTAGERLFYETEIILLLGNNTIVIVKQGATDLIGIEFRDECASPPD